VIGFKDTQRKYVFRKFSNFIFIWYLLAEVANIRDKQEKTITNYLFDSIFWYCYMMQFILLFKIKS